MSEFLAGPESQHDDSWLAVRGSRPEHAEIVQIEIALVRWVHGEIDANGEQGAEAKPAAHGPRVRGLAVAVAGMVTFVCTLVIAVGTVLLCYLAIR